MSSSNRTTLAQMDKMTAEEVQAIPQDQLVMLIEDLAEKAKVQASRKARLDAEVSRRYLDKATIQRRAENKLTGTVNIIDGEWKVKADLPKKVDWDQAKLREAVKVLETEWEEDPTEYVTIEYSVPEKNYTAWPKKIKKLFEPARTLGTGKPTFKIEPAREAA